jgi:hypothetical protein
MIAPETRAISAQEHGGLFPWASPGTNGLFFATSPRTTYLLCKSAMCGSKQARKSLKFGANCGTQAGGPAHTSSTNKKALGFPRAFERSEQS